ncbi:hypothetical protein RclHR1_00750009 [Rhizophagus clarus]|uniref:Uncharacterized protein n=1 Tax=Rhizophagus clarus TaxID=94130 RepID=A0A2Z6S8W9_9GLOM|nr:hypothetical protein RclHR1_00750009 [Rhizophagus clarus]GES85861.1 hypothetical protein GLOIN_2v1817353 [Rhizophagus clarus]
MTFYGKCRYEDPSTGRQCGCQRFSITGSFQDDLCRCLHYENYHESLLYQPYAFGYAPAGPFVPYNIDDLVNQISPNTANGRRQRKPFTCICLLYENSNSILKIPRTIKRLINEGLVKSTYFNDDSDYGIRNEIETLFPQLSGGEWQFFRCVTTANLEAVLDPENGWTIEELKK